MGGLPNDLARLMLHDAQKGRNALTASWLNRDRVRPTLHARAMLDDLDRNVGACPMDCLNVNAR